MDSPFCRWALPCSSLCRFLRNYSGGMIYGCWWGWPRVGPSQMRIREFWSWSTSRLALPLWCLLHLLESSRKTELMIELPIGVYWMCLSAEEGESSPFDTCLMKASHFVNLVVIRSCQQSRWMHLIRGGGGHKLSYFQSWEFRESHKRIGLDHAWSDFG